MNKLGRIGFWQTISRYCPAVCMMTVIYYFSSLPASEIPQFYLLDVLIKKAGHMLGYALLSLSTLRALPGKMLKSKYPAFLIAVLFAVTDEFHQSFVPGRNGTWVDIGIDAIGAGLGLFLADKWKLLERLVWMGMPTG